jgi:hypothetical protein
MVLLFRRICDVSETVGNGRWQQLLNERFRSMSATLVFYQVALGCPSIEPLSRDTASEKPIATIILEEHIKAAGILNVLQKKAFRRLPYPPICRQGRLTKAEPKDYHLQFESIGAFVIMPLTDDCIVVVANNKLFTLTEGQKPVPVTIPDGCQVSGIIVHPMHDVFIAITTEGPRLYDLGRGMVPVDFTGSLGKITCAAFSPSGSKFAFGSDVITVFSFDRSKTSYEAALRWELRNPITALAWMNSDTMLAVGYSQNGVGNLAVVHTFSKYHTPIDIRREWGIVTAISVEAKKGRLVFGTRGGVAVICDMNKNYEVLGIFPLGGPATSIALLAGFVVISAESTIIGFNVAELVISDREQVDYRIVCVGLANSKMVASGEPNRLTVWNAA